MDLSDRIRTLLKEEYDSSTYEAMAKKRGLSYAHIRGIILGEKDPLHMQLDMLFRLFPHARIELEPGAGSVTGTATAGSGTAIVGHHIQTGGNGARDLDAVLDGVMRSDLDPAAKVAVYQIIRQVREQSAPERAPASDPAGPARTCPKCGGSFWVPPNCGKSVTCPHCSRRVKIKS